VTKTFGICAILGLVSLMSIFACTPLVPNKIPLGSALLKEAGIIGYWNFDEKTLGTAPGGTDFADLSGNGHHGRAIGSLTLGTFGVENTAITSTGTGSVEIPIDLSHEKTVSVSLWINQHITTTNPSNVLFEYTADSTTQNGFYAGLDDNSGSPVHALLLWIHGASGFLGRSTPTVGIGWHHIFAVYDQSNPSQNTITLYVDGTLVNTAQYASENANNSGTFADSSLFLLCRGGSSLCLKADIDELILWNKTVTQSEIAAFYSF
jgi:hypothetical protein